MHPDTMNQQAEERKGFWKRLFPLEFGAITELINEDIPHHLKKWWWCLGGTPLILFCIQVATGFLLLLYYVPGTHEAYDSVRQINNVVPYGWFIRSLHKWSANLMIIAVLLHLMRVFFTGAYRSPRQLNWMVGVMLLGITLAFGFTGYSLVYEQMSYWGATVAMNLIQATPLVGSFLADLVRGGTEIGQTTLTRLYILHAAILPVLAIMFLGLHFLLIRLHGVSELPLDNTQDKTTVKPYKLWPDHVTSEIIIALVILYILVALSLLFPVGLGEVADPIRTPEHIKPEWYFYFNFRLLKLTALQTSVIITGILALVMLLWPFIEELIFNRLKVNRDYSLILGVLAIVIFLAMTLWEAFTH